MDPQYLIIFIFLIIPQTHSYHHVSRSFLRSPITPRNSDEQNQKYFVELKCQGTFDPKVFRALYDICDEIFNIYKDPVAHFDCTEHCFGEYFFYECLSALGIISEAKTYERYIQVTHGIGLGESYLFSPRTTNWGVWGYWDLCEAGSYVIGFQLKTEPYQGSGDDSALNGITLICTRPGPIVEINNIFSSVGDWGSWGKLFQCPFPSFATGFSLRVERPQGGDVDDTAANNLIMYCQDGTELTGDGKSWGEWGTKQTCDYNQIICGIRTQIELYQGESGDDTAMNNIIMKCCAIV